MSMYLAQSTSTRKPFPSGHEPLSKKAVYWSYFWVILRPWLLVLPRGSNQRDPALQSSTLPTLPSKTAVSSGGSTWEPREAVPPLIFRSRRRPEGPKKTVGDCLPPSSPAYLEVWIRHWPFLATSNVSPGQSAVFAGYLPTRLSVFISWCSFVFIKNKDDLLTMIR